jgi:hypothetical protein
MYIDGFQTLLLENNLRCPSVHYICHGTGQAPQYLLDEGSVSNVMSMTYENTTLLLIKPLIIQKQINKG